MSRYGLELRRGNEADAEGVADLLAACGRSADPWAVGRRLTGLANARAAVLIAVEWGPPTGLVIAHWLPTLEADAPVAWMTTLLVAPDQRRRGVGRALLKALSQSARQAGCDELRTLDDPREPSLAAFCLATGFERDGAVLVRPLRKRA